MIEQEPPVRIEANLPPEILPDGSPEFDPYVLAEAEFIRQVEVLQQAGEMRRASQIETEEELDEHFDALSRLYRQVCGEMGLPWPPPALDTLDGSDEVELHEDGEPDAI